jgi:hypothetical protein
MSPKGTRGAREGVSTTMARPYIIREPDPLVGPAFTYVKLLGCPGCDRVLSRSGGDDAAPTFHCGRCRHTWSWLTRDARRIIIRKNTPRQERHRPEKTLSRWR